MLKNDEDGFAYALGLVLLSIVLGLITVAHLIYQTFRGLFIIMKK